MLNLFKWIADMWERDSRFRQDRRVERYAREHPATRIVEAFGRLWIDSTPRVSDLSPQAMRALFGPIDVVPSKIDWYYPNVFLDRSLRDIDPEG